MADITTCKAGDRLECEFVRPNRFPERFPFPHMHVQDTFTSFSDLKDVRGSWWKNGFTTKKKSEEIHFLKHCPHHADFGQNNLVFTLHIFVIWDKSLEIHEHGTMTTQAFYEIKPTVCRPIPTD